MSPTLPTTALLLLITTVGLEPTLITSVATKDKVIWSPIFARFVLPLALLELMVTDPTSPPIV